jgi:hypothetical protein
VCVYQSEHCTCTNPDPGPHLRLWETTVALLAMEAVTQAGGDSFRSSGILAQKEGISASIEASVDDETIS